MVFFRRKNSTKCSYRIVESVLNKVKVIRDLGIILDGLLRFHRHLESIIGRANGVQDLMLRMSGSFKNLEYIITLYNSFVRSIWEYGFTIWSPFYEVPKHRIEDVQNKLLRYLRYRMSQRDLQMDVIEVGKLHGLATLEHRRKFQDLCY